MDRQQQTGNIYIDLQLLITNHVSQFSLLKMMWIFYLPPQTHASASFIFRFSKSSVSVSLNSGKCLQSYQSYRDLKEQCLFLFKSYTWTDRLPTRTPLAFYWNHCSVLTLSSPIPLKLYTLPYWSKPPFLIFDIRALWRSGLSARAPECQKLKLVG